MTTLYRLSATPGPLSKLIILSTHRGHGKMTRQCKMGCFCCRSSIRGRVQGVCSLWSGRGFVAPPIGILATGLRVPVVRQTQDVWVEAELHVHLERAAETTFARAVRREVQKQLITCTQDIANRAGGERSKVNFSNRVSVLYNIRKRNPTPSLWAIDLGGGGE